MGGAHFMHQWSLYLLTPDRWPIPQFQTQTIPLGSLWWARPSGPSPKCGCGDTQNWMLMNTLCAPLCSPRGKGHKHHLHSTGVGPHKRQHDLAGLWQGPDCSAQLCGDSHLHPWSRRGTGRPRLQPQPFESWHRVIYEKLLLAGANLSQPRIIGELLLGITPESHKTWVSLQILLERTAVAMSSSLSVEDTPIPAEFWPTKWQELEPCNHRAAIAMSILYNSVHVCMFVSLPRCHMLSTPIANLSSSHIPHFHFSAGVKIRSDYFFPFSLTPYVTNRTFQNFCQSPSLTAQGIL